MSELRRAGERKKSIDHKAAGPSLYSPFRSLDARDCWLRGMHEQSCPAELYQARLLNALRRTSSEQPFVTLAGADEHGVLVDLPDIIQKFLQEKNPEHKKIIVYIAPSRDAARSLSVLLAGLRGEDVGQSVGLLTSEIKAANRLCKSRLFVMTTGVFLSQFIHNQEVGAIIIDRPHHRIPDYNMVFGLCKKMQNEGRLPLTIMTHAHDMAKNFLSFLNVPTHAQVSIGQLPSNERSTQMLYASDDATDPVCKAERAIDAALARREQDAVIGDIVVYVQKMIEAVELQKKLITSGIAASIFNPESALNYREDVSFKITPQPRVFIFTTPIRGHILPRVRTVIDSGFVTQMHVNGWVHGLRVAPISIADAQERAAQYNPQEYVSLVPEIECAKRPLVEEHFFDGLNSVSSIARLLEQGLDPLTFQFPNPIPKEVIEQTMDFFRSIGVVDQQNVLTPEGRVLCALHVEPSMMHMLVESKKRGVVLPALVVALCLQHNSFFDLFHENNALSQEEMRNPKREYADDGTCSDWLVALHVFTAAVKNGLGTHHKNSDAFDQWCKRHGLKSEILQHVWHRFSERAKLFDTQGITDMEKYADPATIFQLSCAIAASHRDRLMVHVPQTRTYKRPYSKEQDPYFYIVGHSRANTRNCPPVVIPLLAKDKNGDGSYLHTVHSVSLDVMREVYPELLQLGALTARYRSDADVVAISQPYTIGGIQVGWQSRTELRARDIEVKCFAEALATGEVKGAKEKEWYKYNREVIDELNELSSLGCRVERVDMVKFFTERLEGVTKWSEVRYIDEQRLRLNILDYVDREDYQRVRVQYPASCTVNDRQFRVRYFRDNKKSIVHAHIQMTEDDVYRVSVDDIQKIFGEVRVKLTVVQSNRVDHISLADARAMQERYDALKKRAAFALLKEKEERAHWQIFQLLPALPEPLIYIRNRHNEPVYAYPVFQFDNGGSEIVFRYVESQQAQQQILAQTVGVMIQREREACESARSTVAKILTRMRPRIEAVVKRPAAFQMTNEAAQEIVQATIFIDAQLKVADANTSVEREKMYTKLLDLQAQLNTIGSELSRYPTAPLSELETSFRESLEGGIGIPNLHIRLNSNNIKSIETRGIVEGRPGNLIIPELAKDSKTNSEVVRLHNQVFVFSDRVLGVWKMSGKDPHATYELRVGAIYVLSGNGQLFEVQEKDDRLSPVQCVAAVQNKKCVRPLSAGFKPLVSPQPLVGKK